MHALADEIRLRFCWERSSHLLKPVKRPEGSTLSDLGLARAIATFLSLGTRRSHSLRRSANGEPYHQPVATIP
jgi:hypothetical protein